METLDPVPLRRFLEAVESRQATVGVIGLGYVGAPLAMAFVEAGFRVVGVDIDPARIAALEEGRARVDGSSGERVKEAVHTGRLILTTRYDPLVRAQAVSICVPTPLTSQKDPDLRWVRIAADRLRRVIRPGTLVVLESTTYPGTTEEVVVPSLERAGHAVGRDVFVCYSPERIDPGNPRYGVRNTPKVIAGVTPACLEAGVALYKAIVETVVPVSSTRAAEMVKLLENTFRSVNIALANEMAMLCERMGIDVWEVIEAARTKPFGFMAFYPGPGTGGHCIPLDPLYLSWKARGYQFYSRFIDLAADVNAGMVRYVADRATSLLNWHGKSLRGARVLILGLAYKRDVGDTRESPAAHLLELLRLRGAEAAYHDPWVPEYRDARGQVHRSLPLTEAALAGADCTVLATDHSAFDYPWIARHARLILDTRGAFRGVKGSHVFRLGSGEGLAAETLEVAAGAEGGRRARALVRGG